MHSLSDYGYDLPAELIAQCPAAQRDHARLLRLERGTGRVSHHRFDAVGRFLVPGDVL
ncbi:MAG: S-adenosylmethionine:tRNA ribosyltransferase-isomerase, partial [Desulfobacterales bacterium]|nr:S-adenosylmethionine:tRNA ribosyltransferase-isomerase [Desulfobacterales bacterium]